MYSYEDRIRAVKLYIKLGKRTVATIRQLAYPTTNALKEWHRKYENDRDLEVGYARSRQKYSDEQKQAAVEHYLSHDRCIAWTRTALGYPCRDTLRAWIAELHPEMLHHLVGKAADVQYSLELKQAAVIELCTRQISAQAIAQKLAVSRPTLYKWKNQLLGREAPPSMKCQNDLPPDSERTELQRQVESLRRDIRQLQLEHDLLKKANELLKKGMGVDLPLLANREKTLLVEALKQTYGVSELLVELDLARSTYFYHRACLLKPDKYADTRLAITDIFQCNHRCYGYRRMRAALGRQQVFISEKVMQHIPVGKVYLSPMIDCFDGLVVSWSIGTRPNADLVNTMLDAAIETLASSGDRPVIHSDRGCHYRWPGRLSRMSNAKLTRSMSRKGYSPDNAACEGFFGRLKTELFYPRNWQAITVEQFIQIVDSYIRWYNEKRIKISLGSLSPREYRESLGIAP